MYSFHSLALISSQPRYCAVNVSIKTHHRNAIDSPPILANDCVGGAALFVHNPAVIMVSTHSGDKFYTTSPINSFSFSA